MPDALAAALEYAARGWPVLPVWWPEADGACGCGDSACDNSGKHPISSLVRHGVKDATTDTQLLRRWWRQFPAANLAIATGAGSGLLVLDVDPRHGGDESLRGLEAGDPLPETIRALTGGGGVHYLYAHPGAGQHVGNRVNMAPGLDIRGDDGYIVVPPSRHASGAAYQWDAGAHPADSEPAPMPAWLLAAARSRASRNGHAPAEGAVTVVQPAETLPELVAAGERNHRLTSIAGSMRHRGMGQNAIAAALLVENAERCSPPLAETEVRRIAWSVARYAPEDAQDGNQGAMINPYAPTSGDGWPVLDPVALSGLAGEIVSAIAPHTEADPAAILVGTLLSFGSLCGRSAYAAVEGDRHCLNEFALIVGPTAKGRKDTARGRVRGLFAGLDERWESEGQASGLSSGEGLIYAVRDRNDTGKTTDLGVVDKRLLVNESEFASVLKVATREGNTLSAILRQAWDHGNLRVLTRTNPLRATGAHISIIGHVTAEELHKHLSETEAANGFANRFLWVCARRSNILPEGGGWPDLTGHRAALDQALAFAWSAAELPRDAAARELWAAVYPELSEGWPGMYGAITSRAEAHVLRLSLIYAALDCSELVRVPHLRAALALWRYCDDSAKWIFGDSVGDAVADKILEALRTDERGRSRTEIHKLFANNVANTRIDAALALLESSGRATHQKVKTSKRPADRWYAEEQR